MRIFLIIIIVICSCSSKKDIILLQDTSFNKNYDFEYKDIKIQPDDILRIKISSKSADLASLINNESSSVRNSQNMLSYQIEGFMVNSNGFVNIAGLQPVLVKDLTVSQVSLKLKNILEKQEVLRNPIVDVKILNNYFTVIGEVNNPGRYNFLENNMNIFQAIGMAGDLTINGKRDDIRIISSIDNKMVVNSIDLTSSNLLSSNSYQIYPDDIIVVNANSARVKNAGIIGNFGNLLSAFSFILSSIILITNN
tara:strand:- start:25 stop:780 length:756 start_codon:yes stop_codon:yes gene_type:complete